MTGQMSQYLPYSGLKWLSEEEIKSSWCCL